MRGMIGMGMWLCVMGLDGGDRRREGGAVGWYLAVCGIASKYSCIALNLMQILPFLSFRGLKWYIDS
jgi:hypothetical protein